MEAHLTLYTFPVSHFAEKVRWLLDHTGIPFQVVNWVPVVHAPAAYWKSGKRTVPFVEVKVEVSEQANRLVVHDSTAIIEWVHQHYSQLYVIPEEEGTYREAMAFEDRADSVGDDVIRYMYAPMLEQHPEDFLDVWGWGAKPAHRHLLRMGLPIVRRLLDNHLDFSTEGRESGLNRLHKIFSELDGCLADGRHFLVGNRFSIADISVASLLAPIYAPDTHPVYSSPTFRNTLMEQQSQFTRYSSFEWMQNIYAEFRFRTAPNSATFTG